jgi:hypothetical protein
MSSMIVDGLRSDDDDDDDDEAPDEDEYDDDDCDDDRHGGEGWQERYTLHPANSSIVHVSNRTVVIPHMLHIT